uniref:Uncharacterized protein n=1 Tax=viral metagenome TaxID=1070528 RepID=A0A6C0H846_9ZZZZ
MNKTINYNKQIKKYNKNKKKQIEQLINLNNLYNINLNKNLMELYNNNKLIIKGEYNLHGIYQFKTNLWIWGTSIPDINKKFIKNINAIRSLNYIFEKNIDNYLYNFYYQFLTEDILLITDNKLLKLINELLLYLSNDLYYFNPINKKSYMQFITLKNIKEQYI